MSFYYVDGPTIKIKPSLCHFNNRREARFVIISEYKIKKHENYN